MMWILMKRNKIVSCRVSTLAYSMPSQPTSTPVSRSWWIKLSSWRRNATIWEKNASVARTPIPASTLLPQVQCSAMEGRISNRSHHRICLIRLHVRTSRQCSSSSRAPTFSSSNPTTTSPSRRIAPVKDRATSALVLVVATSAPYQQVSQEAARLSAGPRQQQFAVAASAECDAWSSQSRSNRRSP